MFQMGYILIIMGFLYGIYTYLCKHKINVYVKSFIDKITNEKGYFRIQFWVSIFNSLFLVLAGISILVMNLETYYLFGSIIIFHIINFAIVIISSKMKYIDRRSEKVNRS